jgi:hypothetical protein
MNRFLSSVSFLPFFSADTGGGGSPAPAGGDAPSGPGSASLLSTSQPAAAADPAAGDPAAAADADPNAAGGDKPAGEGKEGDGEKKPGEGGAPETYADFTLPDGVTVDPKANDDFKALAKELGLSQDAAQKLVDFQGGRLKDIVEAPHRAWADVTKQWTDAIKADPEIGGAKFDASRATAARVFDHTIPGNPIVRNEAEAAALREALDVTGAGNNPAVVRAFARLGALINAEPNGLVLGRPAASAPKSAAEVLYPSASKS